MRSCETHINRLPRTRVHSPDDFPPPQFPFPELPRPPATLDSGREGFGKNRDADRNVRRFVRERNVRGHSRIERDKGEEISHVSRASPPRILPLLASGPPNYVRGALLLRENLQRSVPPLRSARRPPLGISLGNPCEIREKRENRSCARARAHRRTLVAVEISFTAGFVNNSIRGRSVLLLFATCATGPGREALIIISGGEISN